MKRVISGLFLLIALGALGLILAGALSSGEQLVVRFLTAVIVAAIGLYVISDLRLQADDDAVASGARPPAAAIPPSEPPAAAPPQAPAPAFMPTVTGKRGSLFGPPAEQAEAGLDLTLSVVAEATSVANGQTGGLRILAETGAGTAEVAPAGDIPIERPEVARADEKLRASARPVAADIDDTLTSSYLQEVEEPTEWPPVTGSVAAIVIDEPAPATPDPSPLPHPGGPPPSIFASLTTASTGDAPLAASVGAPSPALAGLYDEPVDEPVRARITTGELEGLVSLFNRDPLTGEHRLDPAADEAPVALDDGAALEVPADDRTRELALAGLRRPPSLMASPEALVASPAPSPFGRLNAGGAVSAFGGVGLLERPPAGPGTGSGGGPGSNPGPGDGSGSGSGPDALTLSTIAAASYTRAPLANVIDLRRNRPAASPEIESAIRSGEVEVISSLISQGRLSTEGPISDRDVRTMVYVAFTSSELRKLLMAGGTIDGDNTDLDLGEVEIFYRPSLAAGPSPAPVPAPGRSATALPVLSPPPITGPGADFRGDTTPAAAHG